MSHTRALTLLLKRGALVTAANWPVVLLQFVADALFKVLLTVPIVGGVLLVVLVVGGNPRDLLSLEPHRVVPEMAGALLSQPLALAAFLSALAAVVAGGSLLMMAVKAGSLSILVDGESVAGTIEHPPLRTSALAAAARFSIERFVDGIRTLFPRYAMLGIGLGAAYVVSAGAYLAIVFGGPIGSWVDGTILIGVASLVLVCWLTTLNLLYLLCQVVMAADDCSVPEAVPRVARLIAGNPRSMAMLLAAILALMVSTTAASILATAALGLIAFVPFVGLAALPLQVMAWLVRGLVYQYIALAGAAAYLRLYRTSGGR